jgi:hypothetical protein
MSVPKSEGPECQLQPAAQPGTPMAVLVDGKLVCVTILDAPGVEVRDGVCSCGACQGGRHPDPASDYLPGPINAREGA